MKFPVISGLLLILLLVSCSGESRNEEIALKIGKHTLTVEVVDTPEKRERGLMFRESLDADKGMLFIFEKEQRVAFWMKNTEIPLSLAYISKSGHIREIHDLEPLSLHAVQSTYSVLYALEVNRGYFSEKGIKVGDQIVLP